MLNRFLVLTKFTGKFGRLGYNKLGTINNNSNYLYTYCLLNIKKLNNNIPKPHMANYNKL